MSKTLPWFLSLGFAACAGAQAATVSLSSQYAGPDIYVATLKTAHDQDFTPGNASDQIIGGLMQQSGDLSFLSFCIDPRAALSKPPTLYQEEAYVASFSVQQLYGGYYHQVVDAATGLPLGSDGLQAAAFQLALWELAVDDGNLNAGALSFQGVGDADTLRYVQRAQFMLDHLPAAPATEYTFTRYLGPDASVAGHAAQSLLRAVPVVAIPEPQTWAMLLGGLGALAVFRRRSARPA